MRCRTAFEKSDMPIIQLRGQSGLFADDADARGCFTGAWGFGFIYLAVIQPICAVVFLCSLAVLLFRKKPIAHAVRLDLSAG